MTGLDDKILSTYARGMRTRQIQGHLEEIYKMEEGKSWQNRPLDAVYPMVYVDALMGKIREAGHVRNKAIYVVLGVNMQGSGVSCTRSGLRGTLVCWKQRKAVAAAR